ncbi:MAG: TIGR01777 family oxidoreductase [Planctomycetota bacterium]|jgi:uncharacterized protein (TIGR01777 family)
MNVLVAGGTGFVGRRLAEAMVARGDVVTVVGRDPAGARKNGVPGANYRGWLPELDAYDAVVNLSGANIFGKRWNAAYKTEMRDSRLRATNRLVEAIAEAKDPPDVLVNSSAIGYYGHRKNETLTEEAGPGSDYLAGVCEDWEAAALRCSVRTVVMRTGIVLGPDGGALAQMLPPFKLGLGGPIGFGGQHMSWIHIDDLVGMILWAIDDERVKGPVNATSPGVVTNKVFSKALGRVLKRPAVFIVPGLALRLKFGEVADVLTASTKCEPAVAKSLGYEFRFPEIEAALRDALGP